MPWYSLLKLASKRMVVGLSASQSKFSGPQSWHSPMLEEVACSSLRIFGQPYFFPHPKIMCAKLLKDLKLPTDVNVSVNGCLSLCAMSLTGNKSTVYPKSAGMDG